MVCTGSRVPVLPVKTSGRGVQNSTRKPEVADDIMYSARVQIHVILRMSIQCAREGVHCGVTMETLPGWVPVLPVENYPNPIPEENATRLSPNVCQYINYYNFHRSCKRWTMYNTNACLNRLPTSHSQSNCSLV